MPRRSRLPEIQFLHDTDYHVEFGWSTKDSVGICRHSQKTIFINLPHSIVRQIMKRMYLLRNPNRSATAAWIFCNQRMKKLTITQIKSIMRFVLGHKRINKDVRKLQEIGFLIDGGYKLCFGWIKQDTWSSIDDKRNVITINLPGIITETFIHEKFHAEHPFWKEKYVRKAETIRMKELTKRQIGIIARAVVNHHHLTRHRCPFKRLLKEEHLIVHNPKTA